MKKIGVLALQGDFAKHKLAIEKLGYEPKEIRTPIHLEDTDALIIPGGESTTILKLFSEFNFKSALTEYVKTSPIMGTCAGLIVLARKVTNLTYEPLGFIDIEVERNAYGRQRESFVDKATIQLNGTTRSIEAVFIRAPRIIHAGNSVQVLGKRDNEIVLAENKRILVATFHPELTDNSSIHQYFLSKLKDV